MTHIAFNSKIDTIRTAFSQLWNEVISRSSKRLSGCLSKLQLFCTQTSVCPCALSRSKCLKEDRKKDNKLLKSPLAQYIGFYVLFYNASITIGFDEMIGKECSFVSFSIRLWEISTVSVPQKSRRKWARIARPDPRKSIWGNTIILSLRKIVFWVRVIFVCICSHLSNCHLDDTVVNKCGICHIPTFWSSLNGSFVTAEPFWLISGVKIVS